MFQEEVVFCQQLYVRAILSSFGRGDGGRLKRPVPVQRLGRADTLQASCAKSRIGMKAVVLMATPCTKLLVQEVEVGSTRDPKEARRRA